MIYEGVLSYENISTGTEISYWSVATDASSQGNQMQSDQKQFFITNDFVLGDFENEEALDRWNIGGWGGVNKP